MNGKRKKGKEYEKIESTLMTRRNYMIQKEECFMKGKRIIACALAFVMTISLLGMNSQVINATTNTTTTTPDWLVPRQMDRDVVISVTDNATVSLNTVKSELGNLVSQAGQTQTNINTANINVADLSNWYVYDH